MWPSLRKSQATIPYFPRVDFPAVTLDTLGLVTQPLLLFSSCLKDSNFIGIDPLALLLATSWGENR